MTAALILVFSLAALAQFAVSQWRMIWLTTANQPLSDALRTEQRRRTPGYNIEAAKKKKTIAGWHTFEQSLVKAYEQDLITEETALLYSNNKMKMIQRLDGLNKPRQGHSDSLMSNLRMQEVEKEKLRNKFKPK